jgi:hypothetical protein
MMPKQSELFRMREIYRSQRRYAIGKSRFSK